MISFSATLHSSRFDTDIGGCDHFFFFFFLFVQVVHHELAMDSSHQCNFSLLPFTIQEKQLSRRQQQQQQKITIYNRSRA